MHPAVKKYLVPASIGIVTGVIFAMAKAYLTDEIVDSWIKVPPFEIMNQPFLSLRMRDLAIQAFALRLCDTLLNCGMGLLLFPPALLCGLKAFRTKPNQREYIRRLSLTIEITIYTSMVLAMLISFGLAYGAHKSTITIKFVLDFVSVWSLALLELWMSFFPIAFGGLIYIFAKRRDPAKRSFFKIIRSFFQNEPAPKQALD